MTAGFAIPSQQWTSKQCTPKPYPEVVFIIVVVDRHLVPAVFRVAGTMSGSGMRVHTPIIVAISIGGPFSSQHFLRFQADSVSLTVLVVVVLHFQPQVGHLDLHDSRIASEIELVGALDILEVTRDYEFLGYK
jgi:hypothetical protein